jgi:hypothetical protein
MKLWVLWAVEDDGADVFEEFMLGIFSSQENAETYWNARLTEQERFGYVPRIEERTLGFGIKPPHSRLWVDTYVRQGR